MSLLPVEIIEPQSTADASIIWLHGLGADGHDFMPVVPQLNLPQEHGIRFIFPHAPTMAVTLNAGLTMPAWFDLLGLGPTAPLDDQGVKAADAKIRALIENELAQGIPASRIVMVGFSQGAALALYTALGYQQRLAGCVALSTYISENTHLEQHVHVANRDLPVFMAHGTQDPLVLPQWGEASCAKLKALGFPVSWHTYPIEHNVSQDEIQAVSQFLKTVLALDV